MRSSGDVSDEFQEFELDQSVRDMREVLEEVPDERRLSDEAIDVLARMLTVDPERRPTAQELLEHPWFEEVKSGEATA